MLSVVCYHFARAVQFRTRGTLSSAAKMSIGALFRTLALVVLLLLSIYTHVTLQQTAAQKATQSALGLYDTIRSIASPGTAVQNAKLDSRFILMMPGKVLNYQDYHPGPEYTEFVQVS